MRHRTWQWLAMGAALIALCIVSLGTGVIHVSPGEVLHALQGTGDAATTSIIRNLRMPRILLGALVGAALGMSGGALQGTLRNGLAEPYLLGVSGGAAVGAVIAFAFHATGDGVIAIAAFGGAALAVVLALVVARAAGSQDRTIDRGYLIALTLVIGSTMIFALARALRRT